jgi:hypothetical protein
METAAKKFGVSKKTMDRILGLERASLHLEASRVSVRKKLREILIEEAKP